MRYGKALSDMKIFMRYQVSGHIPPEIGFSLTKTGFKVSQKQYEKFMNLLKVGEDNQ